MLLLIYFLSEYQDTNTYVIYLYLYILQSLNI